ncbi:hypothetical protein [Metasolibacillus sp. FSL K6-0083]|uniref:hypothetical protein n=1 Tax=Metasolibacillus sp. FSL K6-0083 TaxID=2921416 RepID=UPI00315B106B
MKFEFEKKKIISADIFDTLVYRLVSKPDDIFTLVKDKYQEKYGVIEEDYKYLRRIAEHKARKQTITSEISFEDIFKEMPYDQVINQRLLQLEFEIEKENLVLNNKIYELLLEQKNNGLDIILISDMYFSKSQITELLISVGCDLNLFKDILVSSEYKASKAKGDLYMIYKNLFSEYSTDEMVHIGDNYNSDVVSANKFGIEAIYYQDIVEDTLSIYSLEEAWYGESIQQLRSLRKLVNANDSENGEENQLFNIGSQIFGPVYSLFIEWVIQYAVDKNIKKICPLMREGELFSHMLNVALANRNLNIDVAPIYVSRKATYLPSLKAFDEDVIEELLKRKKLLLKDLFDLIQLDIVNTIFEDHSLISIDETKTTKLAENTLYKLLEQFLYAEDTKNKVEVNIRNQKQLLKQYIDELTNKEEFITVDLAGSGSIQKQLDYTLDNEYKSHHLMLLGRIKTLEYKIDGHNFKTWLGYDDKKNLKIKSIFRSPEVIEAVTNIAEPGTSKYKSENNMVLPVKTNTVYSEAMINKQKVIWKGIMAFQKSWFKLDKEKNIKRELLLNRDGFINIFSRLINYPLAEEAVLLGSLIQDDQSHFSRDETIVRIKEKELLNKIGVEKFVLYGKESYYVNEIYWPQGVIATVLPEFYISKFLNEKLSDNVTRKVYLTILKIKQLDIKKFCVYGAGEIGQKISYLCNSNGIKIDSFIDKNFDKSPKNILGIPVNGKHYLDESVDCILIGSQAYYEEIKEELVEYYLGKKIPNIIGLFNK